MSLRDPYPEISGEGEDRGQLARGSKEAKEMKKRIIICLAVIGIMTSVPGMTSLIFSTTHEAVVAADSTLMRIVPQMALRHPRRGHSLTLIGDKIWVTGGRAYYSHFAKWGQPGFEKFVSFPKVEIIDLAAGKVTYTKIETGGPYYKSAAFTVPDKPTTIYLAAANRMAKLDTQKMTFQEVKDFGEKGERTKAVWGWMTIKGKMVVVVVSEDKKISFFDPGPEKFVKIAGVATDMPVAGVGGGVINNKLYLFGGNKSGDDSGGTKAWVFDPNASAGSQLQDLADLPVPLAFPNAAVFGGKVYLCGGACDGDMIKTIFEYDPATNRYIRRSDLPQALNNGAALVRGDTVYLSYGYSWGTEAEGKLGFRTHPEYTVAYQPKLDTTNQPLTTRESVTGKKMNVVLTLPDADKMTGPKQAVAMSWMASTSSDVGLVYYREKGAKEYNVRAVSGVRYGVALTEARHYTAIIENLKPSTDYEYYVVSDGKEPVTSSVYTFRTQPMNPQKYQIFVYGDSKSEYNVTNELNGEILKRVKEGLKKRSALPPAFLVQLGDFGAYGAFNEYEAWFNYSFKDHAYTKEMVATFPFMAIHGNHENLLGSYFNAFENPTRNMQGWPDLNNKGNEEKWFSFNYGPVHYAVITTGPYLSESWYTKDQLDWLKADLAQAKRLKDAGKIKWVFVMFHHSIFTSGEHFLDLDAYGMHQPGSYVDVIESSGTVDICFTAHDHNYERSKNIRGYRWIKKDRKPTYVKLENGFAEESSGRFGEATKGKGTIYIVLGGAGAAQRNMEQKKNLGDASWIAARKPEPDRGEKAETAPAFHYGVITVSNKEIKVEVFEKDVSYLPEYKGADDTFEGLLDRVTIR